MTFYRSYILLLFYIKINMAGRLREEKGSLIREIPGNQENPLSICVRKIC